MAATEEIICMAKKIAAKVSAYQRKSGTAKFLKWFSLKNILIGEELESNIIGGAVGSEFDRGLNIAVTVTLPSDPNPTSLQEKNGLLLFKWLAVISRCGLFVGQFHGQSGRLE